ncbi:AMP-binding protein [Nonomuraea fastidiosa]|uniref:AMP-binding protein n=1 Tax=Nonomuraea TaxID=83681 RepID=UPI003245301B
MTTPRSHDTGDQDTPPVPAAVPQPHAQAAGALGEPTARPAGAPPSDVSHPQQTAGDPDGTKARHDAVPHPQVANEPGRSPVQPEADPAPTTPLQAATGSGKSEADPAPAAPLQAAHESSGPGAGPAGFSRPQDAGEPDGVSVRAKAGPTAVWRSQRSGKSDGSVAAPESVVFPHPEARLVAAGDRDGVSGEDLARSIRRAAAHLDKLPPGPVFCGMRNTLASVFCYLGAWHAGRPIALLDPDLPAATLAELAERFEPCALIGFTQAGAEPPRRRTAPDPHPDLGLLLATSGSTGNPKLVRISRHAVLANARAIATALSLGPGEVAPTSLPLHYSYGLSVLNSHLVAGGTVVLTEAGLLERSFWNDLRTHACTSLAAVPYQYTMLRRMRFDHTDYPALTTLTQAGGRLAPELVKEFAAQAERFYVMYGQTEATARIAVLPPDRLDDKPGSVGVAVPGGRLEIDDGEVVYLGPNVMMGYAETAADLARGDDMGGVLRTGDLGRLDDEGFLYVTGRIKRIAKVFGTRVNLDDVERLLRGSGPVAATSGDDRVTIWTESLDKPARALLARRLAAQLRLHWSGFDVRHIDRLPLLATGKVDYRALESMT